MYVCVSIHTKKVAANSCFLLIHSCFDVQPTADDDDDDDEEERGLWAVALVIPVVKVERDDLLLLFFVCFYLLRLVRWKDYYVGVLLRTSSFSNSPSPHCYNFNGHSAVDTFHFLMLLFVFCLIF